MVTLSKIYTRTGDKGTTRLVDNSEVRKTDLRVEAYGHVNLGFSDRDLRTFVTDLSITERLAAGTPPDALLVTESGILAPADVALMRDAGVHAFLVGEAFMRAAHPGEALHALFSRAEGEKKS